MRLLVALPFIFLCGSAFSQPSWLERCELSGNPYRIRLARLYVLLNGIIEVPSPAQTIQTDGEFALPDDVLFYILRAQVFTLEDAAHIRCVNRRFRDVADTAFRGQIAVDIQDTVGLVRLMALDGSPLLTFIGTLDFAFNLNAITSPALGDFGSDWHARLAQRASESKRPFIYLLSAVLLDFPGFLERNLGRFEYVHTVMFERGRIPWDQAIVQPLSVRMMDRHSFPRLQQVALCSQPRDAFGRMAACFQLITGNFHKQFRSIILDGLNQQQFLFLLSEMDCGRFSSVRTLGFFDVNCGERLYHNFAQIIGEGRLPHLRDLALIPLYNAAAIPASYYDALGRLTALRWLAVSNTDAIGHVLRNADNGGFQSLACLDFASAACDLNAQVSIQGLTRRLPALRSIWVPCSHIPGNLVFSLMRNPRYARLLAFADFDELCASFRSAEAAAEQDNAQPENRYLALLRQIIGFPQASVNANPQLAEMVHGARALDRFDRTHLYTESDIHWLLWLSLGAQVDLHAPHDPLVRDNSVLFPPLALAFDDEAIELETFLENYLREHQNPSRLLVPLNYGDHWMGLLIDFEVEAQGQLEVDIWLMDSVEDALDPELVYCIRNVIKRAFRHVFRDVRFHFERVVPRVQPTHYDCGVALVENLVDLFGVNTAPRQHHMTLQNALELRGHHFRMLRDHGETLTEQLAFRPSQLATTLLVAILTYATHVSARR